ncbi:PucR family transcriptional regulator [Actinomadura kijaniata]|uniref:PucR family transcriptional regulator n=1 Tax=Actinomadura namibiensis TaxID=182080 RepID=A0A7W3LN19_ACTNM|nr:PucR family transcriptional regulator [Actinomadura namibiensis]MBA8951153.1 hypothetical protein [Actinomadura namibiensis]
MARDTVAAAGTAGTVVVPAEVVAALRAESATLADEVIAGIREAVPAYAEPVETSYRPAFRVIVEQAIAAFVDRLGGSGAPHEYRDELCRAMGRGEARDGRALDALQAAYRVGARIAWRRLAETGRRHQVSPAVMSVIADALFAYIDELASLSVQGYLEARGRDDGTRAERHRLLLRTLLRPGAARTLLAEVAVEAGWDVPAEVTMVALPAGTPCEARALAADVLADLDAAEPHLLIPGAFDRGREEMLAAALPDRRAAVGITVPLAAAADSLRWARRALALVEAGVLEDRGPTRCEDHLLDLWLLADGALLDQIARRRFAELADLGHAQRVRVAETLAAWLETDGNAVAAARRLDVHPQTIRYRMRQINGVLGERLTEPAGRFALEATLRASRLLDHPMEVDRNRIGHDGG